ncbi:MAG: SRPBCC family protein [Pseudomonadota bacterium]
MTPDKEIALLAELAALDRDKQPFLDDGIEFSPTDRYTDPDRFTRERTHILSAFVQPLVHSSELAGPGSFLRREFQGHALLITRDDDGNPHIFHNVCRHRGTRLVDEAHGCKRRFSCPYHAWTWSNNGQLVAIPHRAEGFPGLDDAALGLKRLGCSERYGWIWVNPTGEYPPDVDQQLGGLAGDFAWFHAEDHELLHRQEKTYRVNWKIVAEGGLESYHFRVAHRNTIGPYFLDNLSSYEQFGPHIRSVLARKSLRDLSSIPPDERQLRDHAQVLYTLLPGTALLVQSDHIAWIHINAVAVDTTKITVNTLVPAASVCTTQHQEHWARNHQITVDTLAEDFEIGESIQAGLSSGANETLTFGRFEGALARYNKTVDALIG